MSTVPQVVPLMTSQVDPALEIQLAQLPLVWWKRAILPFVPVPAEFLEYTAAPTTVAAGLTIASMVKSPNSMSKSALFADVRY